MIKKFLELNTDLKGLEVLIPVGLLYREAEITNERFLRTTEAVPEIVQEIIP